MRWTWMMVLGALAACSGAADESAAPPAEGAEAADSAPPPAAEDAAPRVEAGQTMPIHPSLPAHGFTVHQGQPGVVDSIVVSVDGRRVQALRPGENLLPPGTEVERLSSIDLDYDGYADLALLSSLAMANSRSEYWRFDPRTRRYTPVGEFETLVPDSAAREHATFNRGGHGGRLWTAARLRWVDGRLVPVVEEAQDFVEDGGHYVRVVRRPQDGRLREAERDTLDDAELRAGPSWMEP